MSNTFVRPAQGEDWPAILALNNAEVPKVGPLTDADGEWFLDGAEVLVLDAPADAEPGLAALLVLLTDGSDYASPNYAWFSARYPSFGYVDRIVVRADRVGTGIGRALYDHAVVWCQDRGRSVLTAEVNLDPPNHGSLAFHRRYGFVAVGEQVDPRNGQTEAMFALVIDPAGAGGAGSPDPLPPVH